MQRSLFLPLCLMFAPIASALDVCPSYRRIHDKEIVPRIRSGIPFKLLSLAADDRQTYRSIVRIEYDLWSETISIEPLGQNKTTSNLKESADKICHALSLADAKAKTAFQYRLMLNPVIGEGLQKLKERSDGRSGLLEINWTRLAKDLETEKTLIESELNQ